jgi:hypothetical protein
MSDDGGNWDEDDNWENDDFEARLEGLKMEPIVDKQVVHATCPKMISCTTSKITMVNRSDLQQF